MWFYLLGVEEIRCQRTVNPVSRVAPVRSLENLGIKCPCLVLGVEGKVYAGNHAIQPKQVMNSKEHIRFSAINNLILIQDVDRKNYFILPRNFSVKYSIPCDQDEMDCFPVLKEDAVAFHSKSADSTTSKPELSKPGFKLIKAYQPESVAPVSPLPKYPFMVLKIKGQVQYQNKTLKINDKITNIDLVKFNAVNNILKVKDAGNKSYFLIPKDYKLSSSKACNTAICKPVLVERTTLPPGF